MRLTCTTSKPPEPSPRSRASTLTTTSSPPRAGPTSADVGQRRPPLAVRAVDLEPLPRTRAGGPGASTDGAAAQLQHSRGRARRAARASTSSMPSSAATLTRSSGWWLRSVPLARFTHGEAGGLERVRVRAAAGDDVARLVAAGAQRRLGAATAGADGLDAVAARRAARRSRRRRTRRRWRRRGGGRPSRPRPPRPSSRRASGPRPRRGSARARRWWPAAAGDRADVRGRLLVEAAERHRGDRARGGDDRAAPVLGADAGVRGARRGTRRRCGSRCGEASDDLADRRGVVEDVAEAAAQRADVERLGARQRDLLADGEQQLDGRRAAARRPPRRATASITATAALLSAPRIASLAFSQPPSTSTGSTGAVSGTVSRCAHSSTPLGAPAAPAIAREQVAAVRAGLDAPRRPRRPRARARAARPPRGRRTRARGPTGSRSRTARRTAR